MTVIISLSRSSPSALISIATGILLTLAKLIVIILYLN